jgi:tetratricopeptide (TPR) repeat protein
MGRYPDSLKTFEQALAIAPTDVDITLNYCKVLFDSGKKPQAMATLTEVLKKHPNVSRYQMALEIE